MLILTHSCNLACRYCFVHQEPCHMTYDTALAATKFLIKNAEDSSRKPSITFFGGEPLLAWDTIIVPLTKWIREEYKKPFNLSLTTNGTLLDEEKLSFMEQNNISFLLSIDGAKETQDYNRPFHSGESSFDRLEPLLPLITRNFPKTTFRMTTIPATCGHIFENIQFAQSQGFKSFFVMPNEFEEWSEESLNTLKKEIRKYGDYYIDSYRNGKTPIYFSSFDRAFEDIKKINNAILKRQYRTLKSCQACGKCGLGSSHSASIHPNGNVYGCQEMTSNVDQDSIFYIGNIFSGIEDERREALMKLFDSQKAIGENCVSCKYNRVCNGGCVANNYMINGSLSKVAPVHCQWKIIILEEAIRVMTVLGNEENRGFYEKWNKMK